MEEWIGWVFIALCFVPLVLTPRLIFNCFGLTQTVCLGLLSTFGITLGVANGLVPSSPPSIIGFMFLIYMCLSLLWTNPIHNGRKEIGLQVPLLLVFLLGCVYIDQKDMAGITLAISLAVAICSSYAYLQTFGIDPIFPNAIKSGGKKDNPIGTIGNPNFLSSYLCGTIWLTVYGALTNTLWMLVVPVFAIFMLYRAKCRAGQVGFFGSLIFFVLMMAYFGHLPGVFGDHQRVIFYVGSVTILTGIGFGIYLMMRHWEKFFYSDIDRWAPQVWYLTLRYRMSYWLAAWELIKQKPILGWGLWAYRKEVYTAQAIINDKDNRFLDPERYLTPQPRECHNDFIEHIVEFGFVGFIIFVMLIGSVYYYGLGYLAQSFGGDFLLMLILLTNLTAILINAFFFFGLRTTPTGLMFWINSAAIVAISHRSVIGFQSNLWFVLFALVAMSVFMWSCVIKRVIASTYFMQENHLPPERKGEYLVKAICWAPDDTLYRTYACIATLDVNPVMAYMHSNKMLSYFDGMTPLWATLHNAALVELRNNNIFDRAELFLKNSHWVLPGWAPTSKLLRGEPDGIAERTKLKDHRRATMRVVSDAVAWQIRAMDKEKENLQLRIKDIQQQMQNLDLAIQNVALQTKKELNIPDAWIYNISRGAFLSQEEAAKDRGEDPDDM
jgi:O-antigen ligase